MKFYERNGSITEHNATDNQSNVSFDLSVAERQQAKIGKSDQKAFQVHFGNDIEAFQKQKCQ
jgi:hypothetical protein